ncbi:MAG: cell division protein FtsZ [Pseudomonadota bacterium]
MSLNLNVPKAAEQLSPTITVIGVGGAGGNAVNNMIQSNLEGVDFLVANTDAQAISQSICKRTIQLGRNITQGLGAGSRPDIGRAAAEEALDDILQELEGSNMVFITAGMGGGTGTGAAPVIARATREANILTVGVVTKPFHFEGVHRMRLAEAGINELQQFVDTLIIIPNQNLFRVANEKTTFADAFKMADDVLDAGVRGVTDLMVMPGLINLDFADIRAVMTEMGKAMMGTGEADGDNRAIEAAEAAISNPLLDEVSMKGARGVLINITGGMDMTLFEVDEAANRIRDEVDPEANIIFGSTFIQDMENKMRVSVVATGIDVDESVQPRPVTLSLVADSSGKPIPSGQAPAASGAGGATAVAAPAAAAPTASAEATSALAMDRQQLAEQIEQAFAEPEQADLPIQEEEVAEEAPEAEAPLADEDYYEEEVQEQEEFIPPQPVEPEGRATRAASPDPFAEAELANSARPQPAAEPKAPLSPGRSKAQSLLAKVTGAARVIHGGTSGASEAAPRPTARPLPARPIAPRTAPGEQRARAAAEPSLRPASQPKLSGLEAPEAASASSAEEELLDIPAFLRRQAN